MNNKRKPFVMCIINGFIYCSWLNKLYFWVICVSELTLHPPLPTTASDNEEYPVIVTLKGLTFLGGVFFCNLTIHILVCSKLSGAREVHGIIDKRAVIDFVRIITR